jgi:hypothetical protein
LSRDQFGKPAFSNKFYVWLKYSEWNPSQTVWLERAPPIAKQPNIQIIRRGRNTEKAPVRSDNTRFRIGRNCPVHSLKSEEIHSSPLKKKKFGTYIYVFFTYLCFPFC